MQHIEVGHIVEMRFGRIRSDHSQLSLIHVARNSNGEDFDASVLRELCLRLRLVWIDVGDSVSDKKQKSTNVTNVSSCSVDFGEHLGTGSLQGACQVRVASVDVQHPQLFENAVFLRVVVKMENNIRFDTELHQSDLCQVRSDPEPMHDADSKSEHVDVPVVVVELTDDQTA